MWIDLALAIGLVGIWVAVVTFLHCHRIWLLYYLCGSIGLAFAIIFGGRSLVPLEPLLEQLVAQVTHQVVPLIGVQTRLFDAAPGLLLVLVVVQPVGWTAIQITIECSGLLESAVIVGTLAFYPGWSLRQRAGFAALGVVLTQAANVVRLVFVITTLAYLGKDALFSAHTIVGRGVFFGLVVLIYWWVLSWPTLRFIQRKLGAEMQR
ncbi:MAG: archaeosortase/exosortase family protein [Chloroflexi bacterium]|nr:archaeosortase/exosortase family protein [Chloroflexota bacterium]